MTTEYLDYKVEDINNVDEKMRNLYKQEGDSYILKVNGLDEKINEIERLKTHNNKLLDEKKKKEAESREQQMLRQQAEDEKAKKAGDYESLLKSSEEKRKEAEQMYKNIVDQVNKKTLQNIVTDIATELCDGANVKIIKPHIAIRIKLNDDGSVAVLDANNNLTVSTLDDLKKELLSSTDFKHLIRGTKATGGNAVGGYIAPTQNKDYSTMSAKEKLFAHYSKT